MVGPIRRASTSAWAATVGAWGLAAAASLLGCGDLGTADRSGAAETRDGGSPTDSPPSATADGGLDALQPGDKTGIPAVTADPSAPGDRGEDDGFEAAPNTCYDGIDNDGRDGIDCEDPGCGGLNSCCVGDGDCCLPLAASSPLPATVGWSVCADQADVAACLAGAGITAVGFGAPRPWIEGNALHPGGDGEFDSGLVLGRAVDLTTHRISLSAAFTLPETGCAEGCVEGAGIAMTAQEDLGDTSYARPVVGLLLSGARRRMNLIVNDAVVKSWTVEGDGPIRYELVIRPTGDVSVIGDDGSTAIAEVTYQPVPSAQLIVYGRNRGPGSTDQRSATLGDLSVSASVCDIPTAFSTGEELDVRAPGDARPFRPGLEAAPSIAQGPAGETKVAFAHDGQIFVATAVAGTPGQAILDTPRTVAAYTGRGNHAENGVDDPELVWDGTQWVLYHTALDGDRVPSIGRATMGPDDTAFVGDEAPVLRGDDFGAPEGLEMPTVLRHEASGKWIMIARVRVPLDYGDEHQLRIFLSNDQGATFQPFDAGELAERTLRGGLPVGTGFDADEIASPTLAIHNGAYQLYYGARRGPRWSIGLLVSDELLYWRDAGQVPISHPSNIARLGAMDPDVAVIDDRIELVHATFDGTRTHLAGANRPAAEGAHR